jgi:divalent metal cation (Fe/Co/Zn/Cd) transporter
LVADAFHSLSDLITDGVVYFSHGVGQMPPDKNHPYGHGRAETIGATVIGLLIIFHWVRSDLGILGNGDPKY